MDLFRTPPTTNVEKLFELHQKIANVKWLKKSTNPHFKSKYINLDDIMEIINPILNDCGLILKTSIEPMSSEFYSVCTELVTKNNERVNYAFFPLPTNLNPQQIGSYITYARRYTICAICNIIGDDDDGNAATAGYVNKSKILDKSKFEIAAKNVLEKKCTTDQIWKKYSETPMETRFEFVEYLAEKDNQAAARPVNSAVSKPNSYFTEVIGEVERKF